MATYKNRAEESARDLRGLASLVGVESDTATMLSDARKLLSAADFIEIQQAEIEWFKARLKNAVSGTLA